MARWASLAALLVSLLGVTVSTVLCTDLRFLATVFLGEVLCGDFEFFGLFEFWGDLELDLLAFDLKVLIALGEVYFFDFTETGDDFLATWASDFC
jgi:hypothetical protein